MSEIEKEATGGTVLVDPLGGLLLEPPNELKFRGPFDDYVTVSLMIKNPTEKRIAFKIKTTAPKRYCVKPNSGVLDSQQTMKVNVLLQPFNYDPNEKNKHKFMVQYMYLNENEMQLSVSDILNMWKDVQPTRLMDIKLKCVFEQSESEQTRHDQSKSEKNLQSTQMPLQTKPETRSQTNRASNIEENVNTKFESVSSSINPKSPIMNANNNHSARLDKNDNLANELIEIKQENDLLKAEINKLKEEEARLRKLALDPPRSNKQNNNSNEILIDLLHNRSSIVIIVLLAIIFYLMLFR